MARKETFDEVRRKSQALEYLMAVENPRAKKIVLGGLNQWRNTLLLAAEHLEYTPDELTDLKNSLLYHAKQIGIVPERSRSYYSQQAALKIFARFAKPEELDRLDDFAPYSEALKDTVEFLKTQECKEGYEFFKKCYLENN